MAESVERYPVELKHEAFLLRAQGYSFRRIARILAARGTPVPARTLGHWAVSREGAPLIEQLTAQLRAGMQEAASAVVPTLFRKIRAAAKAGDAKSADAWSRAIVNVTKGIVPDRLEVTPGTPDAPDELAHLLARHGMQLEQRGPEAPGSSPR